MPKVGIEPTYPRVHDFESCASACSATSASLESILAFQHNSQDFWIPSWWEALSERKTPSLLAIDTSLYARMSRLNRNVLMLAK